MTSATSTTIETTSTPDATGATDATARHWHSVNELLDDRADLQGVHPLADLIYDAVRWSA